MAQIVEVAKSVREYWLSQGLSVSPVKPEELEGLRCSMPGGIPEEYEAFLRIAGLAESEDSEGFRFWFPGEVRATRDVLGEARYVSDATNMSVIIADYLQESWWYALWLTGPSRGQISLVLGQEGGRDPQPPVGKLSDFLVAYMTDDAGLYPPGPSDGAV